MNDGANDEVQSERSSKSLKINKVHSSTAEIKLSKEQIEKLRLDVFFQVEHLIKAVPEKQRSLAMKSERQEKWFKMVSYGLDEDLKHKVVSKKDFKYSQQFTEDIDKCKPIEFTPFALVGLRNYFITNPEKFLSRLSKGPPPQYRWLAWKFVASKLSQRVQGAYA
jgi:hypothetical protein